MKRIPDCVPDALRMILDTAKAVSDDDFIHRKVILKVMGEIAEDGDLGINAADFHLRCWEIACRALGVRDPYENEKARADKTALGVLRILAEKYAEKGDNALAVAVRTSFAGAMLDFTGLGRSDVQENIADCFRAAPARDESADLIAAVGRANSVMLVANRAGEIAMDRPLAEYMAEQGKKVYVVVAATPVFLMATRKDVENAGYGGNAEIVDPGTAMYGLVQDRASSEFQDLFGRVDLVIVKGGTHLGTIIPHRDMFFILKASGREIAGRLGIEPGSGAIVKISATV